MKNFAVLVIALILLAITSMVTTYSVIKLGDRVSILERKINP